MSYGTCKSKVFIETYGCQMNFNDSEIVLSILQQAGYEKSESIEAANAIFLMTCAIREGAENKIWARLNYFKHLKQQRKDIKFTVGVLGCMAERLKISLLETHKMVDIVCGPDAYRDLPMLLKAVQETSSVKMNVALSLEETYADITPVRLDPLAKIAYVSIMRGCNNMCSFCIVPFTRGRERSRPLASILCEIAAAQTQGIKEIVLLGQNVNSYRGEKGDLKDLQEKMPSAHSLAVDTAFGKSTSPLFRPLVGRKEKDHEISFSSLLDACSLLFPHIRFRFTSPHPKDFPIELLQLISDRPNICKSIHLPPQSGSSAVLERMRRGYTRDAYLSLVEKIHQTIPGVTLSGDFIVGFCGETEEEFEETLSLMNHVKYDMAYMFAYSMREKTHAHRNYSDDVPHETKGRRLRTLIDNYYSKQHQRAEKQFVGTDQLVLVEGKAPKNAEMLAGKTDGNRTAVFEVPAGYSAENLVGEFVHLAVTKCAGATLVGTFVRVSNIQEFMSQMRH